MSRDEPVDSPGTDAGLRDARAVRVAVIGGADAPENDCRAAQELGRLLAESGAVVICGGRGGVMEAAAKGAARAGGISIGILPGNDDDEASPHVTIPLPTGLGEARNAVVVRSAHAVVAVGGGWGTLSEVALAAKMGVPVSSIGRLPAGAAGVPTHGDAEAAALWAVRTARLQRSTRE